MNTAVPFTRTGGSTLRDAYSCSNGMRTLASSWKRQRAPIFQVVMTLKTKSAATIGNQPPWNTLARLALKNARSIAMNGMNRPSAAHSG